MLRHRDRGEPPAGLPKAHVQELGRLSCRPRVEATDELVKTDRLLLIRQESAFPRQTALPLYPQERALDFSVV